MPDARQDQGYVISRSAGNDSYQMWRFDPVGKQLLTLVEPIGTAQYNRKNSLIWIGGYFLEWGPAQKAKDAPPYYSFRLFEFDPDSNDPLAAPPVQHGQWSKAKFWGRGADFGNPTGGHKQYDNDDALTLIPLGSFLLNFIPTTGRGTFGLWNFDPCPTAPGTADPIPGNFSYTPEGSFRSMQIGDELLPFNNYVLDRKRATGEYAVWSFDPQATIPLARPTIQQGTWTDIPADHELVPIGDYVLEWKPADRSYRLWRFDATSANPLAGPVRTGTLPDAIQPDGTLFGFQPPLAPNAKQAATPGTIDFMQSKIKHVVYYMLENRSFDHVLGWLHSKADENLHVVGPAGPYKGASAQMYNMDGAQKVPLTKFKNGKLSKDWVLEMFNDDPYHDLSDVLRQMFYDHPNGYEDRAQPDMGGFVWNNGNSQVMETFTPEQLPILNGLAGEYAVSDEWFCSMPSCTDANRAFGLTGSSQGQCNNFMDPPQYIFWPEQPHRASIWKTLWANGITDWKLFNSTEWMAHVFSYQLFLDGQIPTVDASVAAGQNRYVAPVDDFYASALAGTLPAFSYIEPIWIGATGTTSYHPGEDVVAGEIQLNKIYDSIRKGPDWEETLLIITFDEHGGIFDHVPPPYAVNPWPNDAVDGFRYDMLGPRVPGIMVSPWIEPQTVFRSSTGTAYDHTSIIATVLEWFGIPRSRWFLGERAQRAPTLENVLTRSTPRPEAPVFTPPYDKNYPPDSAPTPATNVHHLHKMVAHAMVVGLTHGKLPAPEIRELSYRITSEATDMKTLTRMLDDLKKQYG
ncbi:MAG: alkaline phosphatase family protein [Gemmatimonadaceae bacterium]